MLQSKEILRNIKAEASEIRQLQLKRDWLYSTLLPKGITYKTVDVQESGPTDAMSEKFGEIYELEKVIEGRIQELLKKHLEVERHISKLEDTRYRTVLEMYYLSFKKVTWQQVAEEMDYNEREVYRFHGNALMELEKILNPKSCQ